VLGKQTNGKRQPLGNAARSRAWAGLVSTFVVSILVICSGISTTAPIFATGITPHPSVVVPLQGNATVTSSSLATNSTTSTTSSTAKSSTTVTTSSSTTASSVSTTSHTTSQSTSSANLTSTTYTTRTNSTSTMTSSTLANATSTGQTTTRTLNYTSTTVATHTNQTATSTTSTTNATSTLVILNISTKWDPSKDFYSFLNWGLFQEGGDCYGFSSTAILYFRHYSLGDQTAPFYPVPSSSVSAFPGQTGKYCVLGQCLAQGDTLYLSTFPIYIHQWLDPNNRATSPSNEQPYIQELEQSIRSGTPVVMELGPAEFHAIVAWGYWQYPNGNLRIGVSDPNFGNIPRYANFTNGQFSYTGDGFTYTTFNVVSPGVLQWSWLTPSQLSASVPSTNPYYNFVFSDSPITLVSGTGHANFSEPADSLSFSNSIDGVVGFEEGSIQAYAVPKNLSYSILDPGTTSSRVLVLIPQNATSIVGYQLSTQSSEPLHVTINPSSTNLNLTTTSTINLSLALFSLGEGGNSVLNATSVSVGASQTAVVSAPHWGSLNSTQSAPIMQIFPQGSSQVVTSYTLTNEGAGQPQQSNYLSVSISALVLTALAATGILLLVSRRRKVK